MTNIQSKLNITAVIVLLFGTSVRGQFTSNNQTIVINGVLSNWIGNGSYVVGSNTFNDVLRIINGGILSNGVGYIGFAAEASNNVAVVTGTGSIWSNSSTLIVGFNGPGNQLVVSNGGAVDAAAGMIGYIASSSNNVALVTGVGSVWSNGGLNIGLAGAGNQLIVSNGGAVFNNTAGTLGWISSSSSNNVAVVTGAGSVWSNGLSLTVGDSGAGNRLVISGGGAVFNNQAGVLGNTISSSNNVALVTGVGSAWSNGNCIIGFMSVGNQLVVSNGGLVFNFFGNLGENSSGSNNTARIVDNGQWVNKTSLRIGFGASSNVLTVAGGSIITTNVSICFNHPAVPSIPSNNVVRVDSGSLFVTNALGNATLVVSEIGGKGSLILNGGSVTVDSLIATNGANSVVLFNAGSIHVKGAAVTNAQQFVVGDGASVANYHLLGGLHSFNNGLRVRSNSFLTGCGTINGVVVVDAGGTVRADCGGILIFNGSVTNNGILHAQNGTVLKGVSPVVNNGIIDIMNGFMNFQGGFVNNGTIVNASYFRVTSITKQSNNINIIWTTVGGRRYVVQTNSPPPSGNYTNNFADLTGVLEVPGTSLGTTNYLDVNAATNFPARYYRARLVP